MAETTRCSNCGAELAAGASPEGLCPQCLLKAVPPSDPHEAVTVTSPQIDTPATAPSPELTDGQTFGSYRIGPLLGKGGMGAVYEAEELDSGRRVALKVLTHGLDDTNRARFLREGRLAAAVSHPHTVYVFGTDEIEGIPVIAMELAAGGTLKDLVKAKGPLPPADAVDVILQVMAGLEAAANTGVLHRDIKPSNCFVDSDGTVKVGDFGLSISTLARDDARTQLTMTGTILGTPAFASPEQLHGEELDVRSDIYSVGATLYYLLTGRAPFEEANVLKLATMVAQSQPPSPRQLRRETPKGLAVLTLRCLAKQPAGRVADYERLMRELEPFGSSGLSPARLSTRVLAFFIDYLSLVILFVLFAAIVASSPSAGPLVAGLLLLLLVPLLNFGVAESLWGASIGKAACGLRVHADNQAPGLARGLLRGAVFWGLFLVFSFGLSALFELGPRTRTALQPLIGTLAVFCTARRRNGFAGVHDLVSRTRVAARAVPREQSIRAVPEPRPDMGGDRVGPYLVEDRRNGVVLAYDPRLRRRVWLHLSAPGAPPVSRQRCDLSRPTRLRWLAGRRRADEAWDAYEGVDGTPLLARLTRPQPWADVRHWLRDVAEELRAGVEDASLPDLALDRVWIGADGRARILDWPATGASDVRDPEPVLSSSRVNAQSALRFLRRVVSSGVAGRPATLSDSDDLPPSNLPLSASRFLRRLTAGDFETLQAVVDALTPLLRRPVVVSTWKRTAHLALCSAYATTGTILITILLIAAAGSEAFQELVGDAPIRAVIFLALSLFAVTALVGLLSATVSKGGVLFRALDLAVVDATGREVTRWRALFRALVAWSPVVIVGATLLVRRDWLGNWEFGTPPTVLGPAVLAIVLGLAVLAIGALWAVLHPHRGVQDRIAGTYLVPR